MKREKFVIAGETFLTKKSLVDKCKKLLDSHVGKDIQNKNDIKFLFHLLSRHSKAKEKFGKGFHRFSVQENTNSRSFFIHRIDKTQIDFSYHHCIEPPNYSEVLQKALRHEIQDQIDKFREDHDKDVCGICGEFPRNSHIDHENPQFIEIVNHFVKIYPKLEICHDGSDNPCPWENTTYSVWLKNREIAIKWHKFHKEKAHLRVTCANCNLRRPKKKAKIN